MTDDNDRTQEIRRDGDRYAPSGQDAGYPPPGGGYRPEPSGYGSVPPAQRYGAPVLPADRGSGGFPAAVMGAVVAALVAVGTSYAGYEAAVHSVNPDPRTFSGFFVSRLGLLPWPASQGGHRLTAFLAGVIVVLVITLLLMMAAAMSTRAGTGGFGLFLGAWMSVVLAGGAAGAAAAAIWMPSGQLAQFISNYIGIGMLWGVLYGWIAALMLLVVNAMRRKPVTR